MANFITLKITKPIKYTKVQAYKETILIYNLEVCSSSNNINRACLTTEKPLED